MGVERSVRRYVSGACAAASKTSEVLKRFARIMQ
jgi:hypothetical protein